MKRTLLLAIGAVIAAAAVATGLVATSSSGAPPGIYTASVEHVWIVRSHGYPVENATFSLTSRARVLTYPFCQVTFARFGATYDLQFDAPVGTSRGHLANSTAPIRDAGLEPQQVSPTDVSVNCQRKQGSSRPLCMGMGCAFLGSVPNPPTLVVGTLVASRQGLRFGTPVPPQGASCSLGSCWSVIVTARGYLYPVQGSYDYPVSEAVTIPWHIAGPALAGPGVRIPDRFIEVDPRSAARAMIWTGPNTFMSTYDGGRHWYRITGITHRVAIGFDDARAVGITIGLPGAHACDYYFTYSSVRGVTWRRGPALRSFVTTAIGWQMPSCLANG